MMKLKKEETELRGAIIFDGGQVKKDSVYQRIDWLISNELIRLGTDESGWDILFQDTDNRFWEMIRPDSEQHGGGAPVLRLISSNEAKLKYKINV